MKEEKITKLQRDGIVVIPKQIRELLKLKDYVKWVIKKNRVEVERV